jgi:hypothetical protein
MTIPTFAMAAFVAGALLGLCFKVYILALVPAVSLAAVAIAGFKYESSIGFILFVILVALTALQMGYLFGSLVGIYAAGANEQNSKRAKEPPGNR